MAPIAISDSITSTSVDIGQRIGQLKLNVTPAPAAAPVVQAQKKQEIRVVDPFNYVVGSHLIPCMITDDHRERLMEILDHLTNMPISYVRPHPFLLVRRPLTTSSLQPY
jgi:hypothetical protein